MWKENALEGVGNTGVLLENYEIHFVFLFLICLLNKEKQIYDQIINPSKEMTFSNLKSVRVFLKYSIYN